MPPTIERQVELLAGMLDALAADPMWDPEGEIGKIMPCSFPDLDTWVREAPNEERERFTSELVGRMARMREIAGIDPGDFEGMANLASDDPRVPALLGVLAAKWPSQARTDLIVRMFECALRTQDDLIKLHPNMANTSLGGVINKAVMGTNKTADELRRDFESSITFVRSIKDVRPELRNTSLRVVSVNAPNINFLFAPSGQQAAFDETASLVLPGADGTGFLQSRHSEPGEPGTAAAGLRSYLYRVSLDGVDIPTGIASVSLPVGPHPTLSFQNAGVDADGEMFVIAGGAVGSRGLARAELVGGRTLATFEVPVRGMESSFFFGFAAAGVPVPEVAILTDENGNTHQIRCVVPQAAAPFNPGWDP